MSSLRIAYPFVQSEYAYIDKNGQLVGHVASAILDTFASVFDKFNITFVAAERGIAQNTEAIGEGIAMTSRGDTEGCVAVHHYLQNLPENITLGPMYRSGGCELITSPEVRSSVKSNGPESLLTKVRLDLSLIIVIFLVLMMHFSSLRNQLGEKMSILRYLFDIIVKQNCRSDFHKSISFATGIILWCTFSIQILFCTMMNTERTSISSFNRVDSFDDLANGSLVFVLDISFCKTDSDKRFLFQIVDFQKAVSKNENFKYCLGTGKCTMIASNFDINIFKPFICFTGSETILNHPPYHSPSLGTAHVGFAFNKRLISRKLIHNVGEYTYRSFEMGIHKEMGIGSPKSGRKITAHHPNEECMTKTLDSEILPPMALSPKFFMKVFSLHLLFLITATVLWFSASLWYLR